MMQSSTSRLAIFGTRGQAPWLKIAKIDGSAQSVLQPYLDIAALESENTIRNPRRDPPMPGADLEKLLRSLIPEKCP